MGRDGEGMRRGDGRGMGTGKVDNYLYGDGHRDWDEDTDRGQRRWTRMRMWMGKGTGKEMEGMR